MLRDVRQALRLFRKTPGPTAVTIGTLAVALAAGTVVFSTIDMVVHLVPIADRSRMVFIASLDPRRGDTMRLGVSVPDFVDLFQQSRTIETAAGFSLGSATLTGVDTPARVSMVRATANLPALWGMRAEAGRLFAVDEARSGAARVAVLARPFWRNHFASNPSVVGTMVLLDGEPHTIIGILPDEASIGALRDRDVLVPLPVDTARAARDARELLVTARLKEDASIESAAAEMDTIAGRLQIAYPVTNADVRIQVLPLIELSGFNVRFLLFVLALVAALVVAIACANVMNIVLAQAVARRHERAIRAALGASRFQLMREIMVESLLTSLMAGAAGVLFASWGLAGLQWLAGAETIGFGDLSLNRRVLAAALTATVAAPFVFALLPAIRSSRATEWELKDVGRSRIAAAGGSVARRMIVAGQVAFAMILLVQIALLVRAAWELTGRNPGFDARQLLTFRVELPAAKYAQPVARAQFFRTLVDRIEALPGVTAAGAIDRLPIADDEATSPLAADGTPERPLKELPLASRVAVTARTRRALQIPLVSGRDLTDDEANSGAPVALISEETVRRLWPGGSPLGRRIGFVSEAGIDRWLTVVGVVGNVRSSDADQKPSPQVYIPAGAAPAAAQAFIVRTSSTDPLANVPAIRTEVARLDPLQPIHDVASMEQVIASDLSSTYVLVVLLGAVGAVALCLASAGVYGVVSYAVTQRTREIGVRMALGARPDAVRRMVAAQGSLPAAAGGIVGLLIAVALARTITPAIAEIAVADPAIYLTVVLFVALASIAASYLPARRASRVDPAITLRAE